MKRIISLLGVLVCLTGAHAAPRSAAKKPSRKTAPAKKTVKKTAKKKPVAQSPVAKSPAAAPPSFATRPSDGHSQRAHQRAVELVKQAAQAYARGDYRRAITLCDAANDAYPTYARAHTWMGASYQKLGNYEQAARAYRWAMALAPGTADAQRAERGLKEIGY